jgi:glycosyltransferase involved in cell wall biosynthesis
MGDQPLPILGVSQFPSRRRATETAPAQIVSPNISVVIPTYERAHLVSEAIASVLRQTYSDFELLVVDDGSSDDTTEVVSSFKDERLRLVLLPRGGRSRARNEGAARARGEVVVFLDSDDQAEPDWLRELVLALDGPAAVACCGARFTAERGDQATDRDWIGMPFELGAGWGNRVARFLAGTFAVRRRVFEAIGGYDSRLAFAENSELGMRLVTHCEEHSLPFATVRKPLVRIRKRCTSGNEAGFRARLEAAELILECYGNRNRRAPASFCANYRAIAAVNAYRLGFFGRGIRHFVAATAANPRRFVHWGRLTLALVPPLARRFWIRQMDAR